MKQTLPPNPMHIWFFYLFEQRMDENGYVKCFECGKPMHESAYKHTLTCYSHILEKSKHGGYPQFAGKEWNVMIVHPDCHHLYSMRPTKATNQYNLRLKLLEEHGL